MSTPKDRAILKKTIFQKITKYSKKISSLGQKVRHQVFGFRQRSTAHIDRWALPVKLLHDHRLLQRQRAFQKAGGHESSIATYALEKVRQNQEL